MKSKIVATVDICVYLAFAFLLLMVLVAVSSGQVMQGLMVGIVGWVVLSLLSGAWFTLSGLFDEQKRTNELLEKILNKEA